MHDVMSEGAQVRDDLCDNEGAPLLSGSCPTTASSTPRLNGVGIHRVSRREDG